LDSDKGKEKKQENFDKPLDEKLKIWEVPNNPSSNPCKWKQELIMRQNSANQKRRKKMQKARETVGYMHSHDHADKTANASSFSLPFVRGQYSSDLGPHECTYYFKSA